MDLWDILKLMFRRWYVSVPLLLASLAATLSIGMTSRPDYVVTSHLTLLPPTAKPDTASGRGVNPWNVDSLMGAIVTRLNSKSRHDALEAEGLSPHWVANTNMQFREQLVVEVTADSSERARATTQRLHAIAMEEVVRQQERYDLRPGEEITAIPFDQGENVVTVYKKIYRTMMAVGGAGIVVTTGLVIALDAVLRWRSRRRAAAAIDEPVEREKEGATVGPWTRPAPVDATIVLPLSVKPAGTSGTSVKIGER